MSDYFPDEYFGPDYFASGYFGDTGDVVVVPPTPTYTGGISRIEAIDDLWREEEEELLVILGAAL